MPKSKLLDAFIFEIDNALRTLLPPKKRMGRRETPAQGIPETTLTLEEKKHSAGLMRVNHAGEVCAQGLYQGQALTAQLSQIKQQMAQAAEEEVDHLAWCEQRLFELDSQTSVLNPIWYAGSILLGAVAGFAGDKISLGFVAETEKQVGAHLQNHLKKLPSQDKKSQAIIIRMQKDEEYHAAVAIEAGGVELPDPIKQLMRMVSKLMTQGSYYI